MPIYEGRAGQRSLSSPVRRMAISGRLLVGFSRNTCAVEAKRFVSTFFNSLKLTPGFKATLACRPDP